MVCGAAAHRHEHCPPVHLVSAMSRPWLTLAGRGRVSPAGQSVEVATHSSCTLLQRLWRRDRGHLELIQCLGKACRSGEFRGQLAQLSQQTSDWSLQSVPTSAGHRIPAQRPRLAVQSLSQTFNSSAMAVVWCAPCYPCRALRTFGSLQRIAQQDGVQPCAHPAAAAAARRPLRSGSCVTAQVNVLGCLWRCILTEVTHTLQWKLEKHPHHSACRLAAARPSLRRGAAASQAVPPLLPPSQQQQQQQRCCRVGACGTWAGKCSLMPQSDAALPCCLALLTFPLCHPPSPAHLRPLLAVQAAAAAADTRPGGGRGLRCVPRPACAVCARQRGQQPSVATHPHVQLEQTFSPWLSPLCQASSTRCTTQFPS